nr:immunoglobulin heavy chain junction region [Mus musculus]
CARGGSDWYFDVW